MGRNVRFCCFDVWRMGIIISTRIENKRVSIFFSLFGMERRIAYVNKKYYLGLMWGGVISGLAGVKLFGLSRRFGENSVKDVSVMRSIANFRRFL